MMSIEIEIKLRLLYKQLYDYTVINCVSEINIYELRLVAKI